MKNCLIALSGLYLYIEAVKLSAETITSLRDMKNGNAVFLAAFMTLETGRQFNFNTQMGVLRHIKKAVLCVVICGQ